MNAGTEEPVGAAGSAPGGRPDGLAAGARLLTGARRLVAAVAALGAAEARLLKFRIAVVLGAAVALVAFAVALWASVVALIAWAFWVATGSTGIALALVVALHLILIGVLWLVLWRGLHGATFPETRAELVALRDEIRSAAQARRPAAPPEARDTLA